MKWITVFGTFFELCSILMIYAYLGEDRLTKIEQRVTQFVQKTYKQLFLGILILYAPLWLVMTYFIGGYGSYQDCLKPLFANHKIDFSYSDQDTWLIAYMFICSGFVSWVIYAKIFFANPTFFPLATKIEKTNELKVEHKRKNKTIHKTEKRFILEYDPDKLQEIKSWFLNQFIISSFCTIWYLLAISNRVTTMLNSGLTSNSIIWATTTLSLILFYLNSVILKFASDSDRELFWQSGLSLAIQITAFIYFCFAGLYQTWNIFIIFPFALFSFINQLACFTGFTIKQYKKISDLENIQKRFGLYAFMFGALGVTLQLITAIFA